MSFIIDEEKTVRWPVIINEPVNGGKIQRRKIELDFLIDDPEAWEESDESILQVLQRVIIGWDGPQYKDKTPVEFNDESLNLLLKKSYVRTAIWAAYTGEVLPGAPAKN